MNILLGTRNRGKIQELLAILNDIEQIEWLTEDDVSFSDVIEDGATFESNALKKARQISTECNCAVLAEDAGLEVEALNGEPGVRTARYAGDGATHQDNISKLLANLANECNRKARFLCFAALVVPNVGEWITEGELKGIIAENARGRGGFGYDPVFIPDGYTHTLAELNNEVKNKISHRYQAVEALKPIFKQLASDQPDES